MITMGLGRSEPSRNHLTDCGESIYVTSTLTVGRDLQERPPAQRFPVHAAGTADRGRKDRCPTTGQRAPSEEVAASRLPTGLPCSRTCQWSQNASLGMPHLWYGSGMARTRISTTVDAALLAGARRARSGLADSALIDEALAALLARQRAAEIDAAYAAYNVHPLDERDEWGDLASFREAAGAS